MSTSEKPSHAQQTGPEGSSLPAVMIWRSAERLDAIASDDRSLRYGDGLFETVRVLAGKPVLMEAHWARLSVGCERLGIPDESIWRAHVAAFLAGRHDGIVRIQVSAGSGGRGYGRPSPCQPVLVLSWFDESMPPRAWSTQGICIGETRLGLAEQPALAGIKHSNRLEQVLLRQELSAMPECQEALVYDQSGRVVEGVFSNVFFISNGQLHTPALSRCGVRGVLRDALLNACNERAMPVLIGDFTREDLLSAEAIFFVNSINGLWPVRRWCVAARSESARLNLSQPVGENLRGHDKAWRIDPITRQCQDIIAPWFANA
ncbi:MAG: aminodeoxychorismate lyase [Paraperlucidibaca sp.]